MLITEGLMKRGYPTLLLTGTVEDTEASMEDIVIGRGLHPVRVRSLSRTGSLWNDCCALWQLFEVFRRERPSIVHTHTAKAGALGRIAAHLAGVPICVHTFHGHVFRGHFPTWKAKVYLTIERFLARWTDCLVALSQEQRRDLIEEFRIAPPQKVVTIRVGFDLERFLRVDGHCGSIRNQIACPNSSPLIGWVGRLAPIKDPELFVELASLILASYPSARLLIIGDGELRQRVEVCLKERHLTRAVTLMGWQSDLSDFYADIDLLVMTSRHEGTPLALLEAMASSRPFVATGVGGIPDLMSGTAHQFGEVRVFQNGVLAGASASSLFAGVRYLLEDPKRAVDMGRAGRAFTREAYANSRVDDELENLYQTLLKQKSMHL